MDNQLFIVGEAQDKNFLEEIRDQWAKKEDEILLVFADQLYLYWEILIKADRLIIAFSTEVNNDFYNLSLGRLQNGKRSINLFLNPIYLNIEQKYVIGRNKTVFKDLYDGNVAPILENIIKMEETWEPIPEFILPPEINNGLQQAEDDNLIPSEYYEEPPKSKSKLIGGIIAVACIIGFGIWGYNAYVGRSTENTASEAMEVEEMQAEEVIDFPQGSVVYLSGKVDNKYPVHMVLDFNSMQGAYYYDKYGKSNMMRLDISSTSDNRDGTKFVILREYNMEDEYTGKWEGDMSQTTFSGKGIYLHGQEMPFNLKVDSSTDNPSQLIEEMNQKVEKYRESLQWKDCEFVGYAHWGDSNYPVKITAQKNDNNEFQNGVYYNLDYNASFPVRITYNEGLLKIDKTPSSKDFQIIVETQNGQQRYWDGHMYNYNEGMALPIDLELKTISPTKE